MKTKFLCTKCNSQFEATGKKQEWKDPIYGPCFKYVAFCPVCKEESNEYNPPKVLKNSVSNHDSSCGCCNKAGNCGMAEY